MNKLSKKTLIPVIILVVLLLWGADRVFSLPSQEEGEEKYVPERYSVTAATSDIKVDGVLNEKAWEDTSAMAVKYEYWPGENIPAPVKTDFLITYNKDFLYMAFRCYDADPSKIRAHYMNRDDMEVFVQDDHVVVLLDTFNDERRAFQFRVNPLGVQADAFNSDLMGSEDWSWDAIWNAIGKITEWGYAVEISIPFNQLRFPDAGNVQTWGVSAARSFPRNVRHRIASHKQLRNSSCYICQFNKMTGFQGMKTGLNMEIAPTFTANRTDVREEFPSGGLEEGKIQADPGLSLRWGITPNLILNTAINPDFSQVEADVAQLEVNTRFAIRYPEKRPFFLEGADFFLTPFEAVFTRTVADPDGGLKFTGKTGKNAFGIFGTYDRLNNIIFPSNQGSLSHSYEQDVAGGVFRYRRDIGRNSALGVLYTGRVSEDYHNHMGGVDAFFRLSDKKTFEFQYLHSDTQYPMNIAQVFGQEQESFGGDALQARFQHYSRGWIYTFRYRDLSPGFRADSGYIPRVDLRDIYGEIDYQVWGKQGGWFSRMLFGVSGQGVYDHDGTLTDQVLSLYGLYWGPLQSQIQIGYNKIQQLHGGILYELDNIGGGLEIKPAGGVRLRIHAVFGDSIDYINFRQATELMLAPLAEISLGKHININLQHAFQRLSLSGDEVFQVNLSQVRLVYNVNTRIFLRAIVQYLDLQRNPLLHIVPVAPETQTVFTQFLFSYKLNPQTVLFIGYSDNYLGLTGIDITQTNRTFFIKLGYAWLK